MELILIRHGESEGNRLGIHHGWGDFGLTDVGRKQASKTHVRLRDVKVDKVIASDSVRASETAQLIFPTPDIELEPLLRETNCGELSGLSSKQATTRFGAQYTKRPDPFDLRPFGGEHVRDMEARVKRFMNELESIYSDSTVAIVTHGGPLKVIVANVLNSDFISICDRITFSNCSISRLQLRESRWVIQYLNDATHLTALVDV